MVGGCTSPICNAIRSLEWEAMSAGLFGLAGGLSVISATRLQISAQLRSTMRLVDQTYDIHSDTLQRPISNAKTAVEQLRLALEELHVVLVRTAGDADKITNQQFYEAEYIDRYTNECRKINPLLAHVGDIVRQIGPREFTGETAAALLQVQEKCALAVSSIDTWDLRRSQRDKTHSTTISSITTATSLCMIAEQCLSAQLRQIRSDYSDTGHLMRKLFRSMR